jgi:hypothetical protein
MILKKGAGVFFAAIAALWLQASAAALPAQKDSRPPIGIGRICDPALTTLFTPQKPLLGRYEVCTDSRPLPGLASDWKVESLESGDAFGMAGSVDRAALARLYRGTRAQVARGWTLTADRFETMTLVSPYPNARLTQLEVGTLMIRWVCDRGQADCKIKIPDAR